MSAYQLSVNAFLLVALLAGCGGGGGDDSSSSSDFLGTWTGRVTLISNSCPRPIPQEAQTLFFSHQISETLISENELRVSLNDNGTVCNAEQVSLDSDTFSAVCPRRELPGFIEGLQCTEELVWTYTKDDRNEEILPVQRTAYVLCSSEGMPQLACPVEYSGIGARP